MSFTAASLRQKTNTANLDDRLNLRRLVDETIRIVIQPVATKEAERGGRTVEVVLGEGCSKEGTFQGCPFTTWDGGDRCDLNEAGRLLQTALRSLGFVVTCFPDPYKLTLTLAW